MENSTPCKIVPRKNTILKLCIRDYVGEVSYPNSNMAASIFRNRKWFFLSHALRYCIEIWYGNRFTAF